MRDAWTHLERRAKLIGEGAAPDGRAAFTRPGRVAGLDHESADVAVEEAAVVIS